MKDVWGVCAQDARLGQWENVGEPEAWSRRALVGHVRSLRRTESVWRVFSGRGTESDVPLST